MSKPPLVPNLGIRASELRLHHSHSLKLLSVYAAELEALLKACHRSALASNSEAVVYQIEAFDFVEESP